MLELRNIHKKFGGLEVLKGVDIAVEKGDIIVILGPSGSGKTTLLRCINFLERADEGSLHFDEIQTEFSKASKREINAVRKNRHSFSKTMACSITRRCWTMSPKA